MKTYQIILIFLIAFIVTIFLYKKPSEEKYYPTTEKIFGKITKYYIYGQSFNIEGNLRKLVFSDEISDISLILKNGETESNIKTIYTLNANGINFKTSDEINNGIILDNIAIGSYFLILKISYNNNLVEYYTLQNNTKYNDLDYYTMTKNKKNNYVTIRYIKKRQNKKNIPYVKLTVKPVDLPNGIYDIIIDPGHGGPDSGAYIKKIHESDVVLEIAKKLQIRLTEMGFKVKLTRDGDFNPGGDGIDPYWHNGRVNMANNTRAKYLFSIHLNSAPYVMKKGGVEIYSPMNADLDLAKSIADNIVRFAKTTYSPNHYYQKFDGVYVRTFTTEEIAQSIIDARNRGYAPYNITTNTIYHYIVREPGAIATNAYIDGRYNKFNKNNYYDYNIGVESYLLELGFMVNNNDLFNVIHNQYGYVYGIKEGIRRFLNTRGYSL